MKKGKKLVKQIGRMTGKRLFTVHYTLLGRIVYHLCKLETKQLKNMVDNVVNLSKVKRKTKGKTKGKKLKGKAKAKFLARMNKGRKEKGLKPIRSKK